MATDNNSTTGFYFSLMVDDVESVFQEVSGMATRFGLEPPSLSPIKYENLVFKRGAIPINSPLASLIKNINDFKFKPKGITLNLKNQDVIIKSWIIHQAYPVSCKIDKSLPDALAIEELEFAYTAMDSLTSIKITAYADDAYSQLLGGSESLFDAATYKNTDDKELYFELAYNGDVDTQITRLKKLVYNYNGNIHQPNYLKIDWNGQVFKGRLSSLNVNYTSLKRSGAPKAAVVALTFNA